jgi:hypothetical protein
MRWWWCAALPLAAHARHVPPSVLFVVVVFWWALAVCAGCLLAPASRLCVPAAVSETFCVAWRGVVGGECDPSGGAPCVRCCSFPLCVRPSAVRPLLTVPTLSCRVVAVIIFDWDDTLMSSTWLASHGLRLDEPEVVPPQAMKLLAQLEASVVNVLQRALFLGHVTVITNAETGWVELSARKFMPGVLSILKHVHVVSARSLYERLAPESPADWKVRVPAVCRVPCV